jgi:hypothetical protein
MNGWCDCLQVCLCVGGGGGGRDIMHVGIRVSVD